MKALLLLTALALPASAFAQASAASSAVASADALMIAAVDRLAAKMIAEKQTPGLAIGIARDGKPPIIRGYGLANLEDSVPVTANTVFRVGSVTKQFTAAAILLLAEEGKLSLDDTVAKYFPTFPRGGEVTVRQLLNHTSGIHNYTSIPGFSPGVMVRRHGEEEMLAYILTGKPLYDFDPGTGWSYSNSGYILLDQIVGKASGQPLAAFLKARLFDPLGLADTRLDEARDIVPHRAQGYDKAADAPTGFVNTGFIDTSVAAGAGAIRSTPADLIKWTEALLGGRVLKPASLQLMLAPGMLKDGRRASAARPAPPAGQPAPPPADYGFGITTGERNGRRTIGHGGSINGFNSSLTRYPDQKTTIVLLTNTIGPANANTQALAEAVLGTPAAR